MMPALLTTTSRPPNAASAVSNRRATAAGSAISACLAAAAPVALDLRHQRFGGGGVAGIVDDDGEAVAGQTLRDRGPDTTGGSGNDRDFAACVGHGLFLICPGDGRLMRSSYSFRRMR